MYFSLKIIILPTVTSTCFYMSVRKFVGFLAQWIFSSHPFRRSCKLSCRRLLKCDRCSSTDRSEGWPFFGGQLWWSNGSVLSLSYSCFMIEKGHFLKEYWIFPLIEAAVILLVECFIFTQICGQHKVILYLCVYRDVWVCIPGVFFPV